ncbi:uncharacterized protein OCT59_023736 [Rhizophagus irregularis]|uniref:uncharacterized protein n=1 Tax=Rhizophagus irregularis TaxID=588596 RepID=UPI00331B9E33|nr:hypothetical protein OCT59_023736 [Rhizophagus irregularis]
MYVSIDSVYKFPDELVNLLTELFLERKNKVFTPGGLTEEYDVQCGIDQGEIISPLLWIIYYDPLLSKIKNSGLGYNIDGKRINDNNELGQVTRIRLYNLQELLLLVDDPLSSLTVNDIISHGFDVKNNNNSTKNLMKVPGDSENNRKIKKEIYDKLSHGLAKNLKGTDIKPVAVDPLSWKSFVAVVGSNSKVIYGKKYNTMNGWIIMEHFEVLSNPMDMSIVMRKCEGCALNERDKLSNEYLYKNSSCLLASRTDCTFYLENIKNSKVSFLVIRIYTGGMMLY